MLTMTDLMRHKATTGDHRLPVTEVFFHERTGQLRYVALHTGGTFEHADTLVAIGRFAPPGEGDWQVTLSDEDIRSAPGWDDGDADPRVPMPLEAWPPILVGPFGTTTSPLMFYAAMMEATDDSGSEPRATDPRVDRLERATRRLGAEVFGADGPLGRLDDFVVTRDAFVISAFLVGGRLVPYDRLRHMSEEGAHTVLNIDKAGFEALPAATG